MRTCPCGSPLVGIRRFCEPCRARRRRESNLLTKLKYVGRGACRDCGGELATTHRCRKCQDKRNAYYRANRLRWPSQSQRAAAE